MDAAERAQAMLDKNLATAVIVLLSLLVVAMVRALVKTTNARVDDAKAVTAGVMRYVEENTRSNIALTRAVETKLTRRPRGQQPAAEDTPVPPPPTPPKGAKE